MKIPKSLRIGALEIRVSRKKQKVGSYNGREWRGYYDKDNSLIWVCPNADDPLQTFWHEFFHAAIEDAGLRQIDSWNHDVEEIICEKFGRYVSDFLRQKK